MTNENVYFWKCHGENVSKCLSIKISFKKTEKKKIILSIWLIRISSLKFSNFYRQFQNYKKIILEKSNCSISCGWQSEKEKKNKSILRYVKKFGSRAGKWQILHVRMTRGQKRKHEGLDYRRKVSAIGTRQGSVKRVNLSGLRRRELRNFFQLVSNWVRSA